MSHSLNVLLVENQSEEIQLICRSLEDSLEQKINWIYAQELSDSLDRLSANGVDLVLMDLAIEQNGNLSAFKQIHQKAQSIPIIVLAETLQQDLALEAIQIGARDYVIKDRFESKQLVHTFRHALKQRRTESRLRETENKFHLLFENSPDAIYVIDLNGLILDVNQAGCDLLGYSEQDLSGRKLEEYFPEEHTEEAKENIQKILKGEIDIFESFSFSANKILIPVEIRGTQLKYEGSDALVLYVRDISQRKAQQVQIQEFNRQLEKRVADRTKDLEEAMQQLKDLDKMKSTFMNIASHELRTPLAAVTGMLNIIQLKMPEEAEGLSNAIQVSINGAERLSKIVERTLKIMQAQNYEESSDMKKELIHPQEIMDHVSDEIKPFLELRSQHLVVDIKDDIPQIPVEIDLIQDTLQNLLMNAIKFTEDDGYLCVSVRMTEDEQDVIFRISDTGTGVKEEDRPHVFREFFSSFDVMHHSSGTYEFESRGIGLGLAFVKKFVEMHKGKVGFETIQEIGSMFYFTLPIKDPDLDSSK